MKTFFKIAYPRFFILGGLLPETEVSFYNFWGKRNERSRVNFVKELDYNLFIHYINSMKWQERITIDPKVLGGKPVVKGTRISIDFILELLSNGWSQEEISRNYPSITGEDIYACLGYASYFLREERIYPLLAS